MGRVFEKYLMLFIRIWFGAFNLASGTNYYMRYWPWPQLPPSPSADYISAAEQLHLFDVAKITEAVVGLMLLFNVAVPLGLILLFPMTTIIFIMNAFYSPLPHIIASGTRNFLFHLYLFAAYAGYYAPLLKLRAEPAPVWRNLSAFKKSF